jgi:DNA polymerase I-like protein with 3'-5' exonuclease and polymerase domains
MKLLTVDFETFYSQEFSLTRLTTEAYVRSPEFETIGVSVKVDDAPAEWFSGTHREIKAILQLFDFENSAMLAQNTHFDGAILEWLYDIHPKRYFDTLSMANALVGVSESVSLKNLAILFGTGEKGTAVQDAKGKHLADFSTGELVSYGDYCINDVEQTHAIFKAMLNGFTGTDLRHILPNGYPMAELKLIDTTIKMFTRPTLVLDAEVLQNHLWDVQEKKRDLINSLMTSLGVISVHGLQRQLNSNPQFAALLRERGVEPPMKTSPTTGKETYAFAKTDEAFLALTEHDDPEIQALCLARLGTKSTIEETRTEKFLDVASRGTFPIPLKYSGASVSQRWSGFDLNVQNLPRKSPLRAGICAPKGYKLIIVDLSNIELRLGLWLAGQDDKVELIRQGVDLYKDLASTVFKIPYDDIAKDSMERTVGKVISLAGIYGTSGAKTKEIMRIQAKVNTPLEDAKAWIDLYRRQYFKVKNAWEDGEIALQALINGTTYNYLRDGVIRIERGMMIKPNGMILTYPNLRRENHDGKMEYRYDNRGGYVQGVGLPKFDKVYSSKVYQRCVQSLARDIMAAQMAEISKNHTIVNTVHDELWVLAKESEAESVLADVIGCMTTPPSWCLSLPLGAEGGVGDNYADSK